MDLSDTYIRITLNHPLTEQEEQIISLIINECITKVSLASAIDRCVVSNATRMNAPNEFPLLEEEGIFEGLLFETEEGHSIEFPLTVDLKDYKVEQICNRLSEYIENFTVEASGNN
jgi:hypothetical protein